MRKCDGDAVNVGVCKTEDSNDCIQRDERNKFLFFNQNWMGISLVKFWGTISVKKRRGREKKRGK